MTKRYMLFSGAENDPAGGIYDFECFIDNLEVETALEKMQSLKLRNREWAHIYDIDNDVIVDISYKDLSDKGLNDGRY